ncbi:hypothetical protein [Thiospirochaeta perfilievii]|uniref:hypothetical protein n=1 Tax=Thiospirochaeta perfilievii TaxID=252967 RepID=UPI0016596BBB|nr:hypothetical protein [Thiospirochaeta perfilievii]
MKANRSKTYNSSYTVTIGNSAAAAEAKKLYSDLNAAKARQNSLDDLKRTRRR